MRIAPCTLYPAELQFWREFLCNCLDCVKYLCIITILC